MFLGTLFFVIKRWDFAKVLLLSIIQIVSFIPSFSQTARIDSLKKQLETYMEEDSIRADLLYFYGDAIFMYDLEKLDQCARDLENTSRKINYSKGLAYSYLLSGCSYMIKSDCEKSVHFYSKATQILELLPPEKGLADAYLNLGINLSQLGNIKAAIDYMQKSIKLSREIGYGQGISNVYNYQGIDYMRKGELDEALSILKESLNMSEENKDNYRMANTCNNLGKAYREKGDYINALKYYKKALEIRERFNLEDGLSNSYNSLGIIYDLIGEYTKALDYFNRSLELRLKTGNDKTISGSYNNICAVYNTMGDYEKALEYGLKGLAIKEDHKIKLYLSENLNNVGNAYFRLGNIPVALKYYHRALTESVLVDEKTNETLSYKNLAELYSVLNEEDSALYYGDKCYRNAIANSNNKRLLMDCSLTLSKLFEKQNDFKKAYHYQTLYKAIYDSIYDAHFIGQLNNLELQSQYEREKAIIQNDLERQKSLYKKKQQQLAGLGIILGLITIGVIIIIHHYRKTRIKNKKLFEQNLELISRNNTPAKKIIKKPNTLELEAEKEMLKRIEHLMSVEKSFKDPAITLAGLAEILETNRTYLSRVINDNFQCNFNKFINTYRVEEARKMLSNKEYHHLTFEAIANDVGFNSRSAFNIAFKEVTGITPSYFKASILDGQLVEEELINKN